jgi:DNA mismatch repair protein MSH3
VLDLTDDGDGDGDGDGGSGSSSSSSSAALAAARLKSARPDMIRAHKFGSALATLATHRSASSSSSGNKQSGGSGSEAGPFSILNVPKGAKLTPLEKQVVDCKKDYPDCLLMVQVGYKVMFFGEDAVTASQHLGIYHHQSKAFMVAAVPTFRVLVHLRRLVKAGQKVGQRNIPL